MEELQLGVEMWTEVGSSAGFCDVLQLLVMKHSAI